MEEKYRVIEIGPEYTGKNLRARIERVNDSKSNFRVDVVEFPNSVAVLPIKENGRVILERHYRHPIRETILEVPAGKLEPNEDPENGARRELLEETGFDTKNIQYVGSIFAAPGYSTEVISLFVAQVGSKPEHSQKLEATEKITLEEFSAERIHDLIARNELRDSMTISLIFLAKLKRML